MRTTKELLEVTLENIDKLETGLCKLVYDLADEHKITKDEYLWLRIYINNNPPRNLQNILNMWDDYYWRLGKVEPRIKWLKKHIEKNS
jgi:hypothetical protein